MIFNQDFKASFFQNIIFVNFDGTVAICIKKKINTDITTYTKFTQKREYT